MSASPRDRHGADFRPGALPSGSPADEAARSAEAVTTRPASVQHGGWANTFSSLRYRGFRRLWTGTMFMWCADQFQAIAQGYLAYTLTGSAGALGVISVGYGLPVIVLALFGGALADRFDRKRLIQLYQGAQAVVALGLAISVVTGTITWYHILAGSVIQGMLYAFMLPARQAMIPQLVERSQITNAMALNSAGMSSLGLTAPAIAGFLYASLGAQAVFFAGFGLQIIAVVLTGSTPSTGAGPARSNKEVLRDIKEGLSHVRGNRMVVVLLIMAAASMLFAMPITYLMPVFVVEIYHRQADAVGLLVALMGAGSLAGSLLIATLGRWRRGILLIAASFLAGTALLLLAAVPYYLAGMAVMLVLGLGILPKWTLTESLTLDAVDDQFRGRVMSLLLLTIGLIPLGVLPLGMVADLLGPRYALGIMAGMMLLMSATVLATQKRLREAQ